VHQFFKNHYSVSLAIAILAGFVFIPYLGGVHLFDWDEINFAECAREMIVSNDFLNVQINFKPFWEKPPLFIWMQVLSMKTFGVNEFAARFPNAVCGIVSLVALFNISKRIHSTTFGLWWVFVYAGSILPHFYFRSGIIDPWFNLLIFISIYFFFRLHEVSSNQFVKRFFLAALWGVFTGFAILTKGPTALLIVSLVTGILYFPFIVQFFFPKQKLFKVIYFKLKFNDILLFLVFTILIGGSWFLIQIFTGHTDMVLKFILYQIRLFTIPDAGHGGHWSYHFIVLLFGVFPASVFALNRIWKPVGDSDSKRKYHLIMIVLFWCVLILFSIVKTKIVHYSSLCYFPISYMATLAIQDIVANKLRWKTWQSILLLVIGFIFSSIVAVLPLVETFKTDILNSGMIKDKFALANLQANVLWTGFEWIPGVILLTGLIFATLMLKRNLIVKAFLFLFGSSTIFVILVIFLLPYRIEKYSQGAVIEFYKQKANEKCYILNVGYFSYAPPFYASKMPDDYARPMWLLTGNIDRPFYLVLKQPHYEKKKHIIPAMKLLYKKNGWVFLARYPKG